MSDVKITEIQGRGRAVIASKPIKPGQIILRESPILLYPTSHSSKYCSHCFRKLLHTSTTTTPCPSCSNHTLFCTPACQTIALSSSHSPLLCETLTLRRSLFPSLNPDLQTQANFLISAYNLALVSPSDFHLLLSLHGAAAATDETLLLHSFISVSRFTAGASPELTAALLAKDKYNAFGLMEPFEEDGERSVRAYAIYPTASFFNHDCLPNACRFDYVDLPGDRNTDIVVRALHDVPAGREICLSYFPVDWRYADRRQTLMEDYGFECGCDRCGVEKNWRDGEEDDDEDESMVNSEEECGGEGEGDDFPHSYFFMRYLCDGEGCGGTLAPLPPSEGKVSDVMECNVCGKLRKEEEVDGDESGEDRSMLDE